MCPTCLTVTFKTGSNLHFSGGSVVVCLENCDHYGETLTKHLKLSALNIVMSFSLASGTTIGTVHTSSHYGGCRGTEVQPERDAGYRLQQGEFPHPLRRLSHNFPRSTHWHLKRNHCRISTDFRMDFNFSPSCYIWHKHNVFYLNRLEPHCRQMVRWSTDTHPLGDRLCFRDGSFHE